MIGDAFSAPPVPFRPMMMLRMMMPMMSSRIAAESMVVPAFVLSLPISRRVSTVIETLVAVRITPTNTFRSMMSVSIPTKPP